MKKGIDHIGNCVVFFCHDGNGKFILARRTNKSRDEQGKWEPGGGGINFREPVIKTLKREIKKEYGTSVIEAEFLGYRDVHRTDEKGRRTHWIALDFKVFVDKKKVKNADPEKHDRLEWFGFDNLPSPMHSQWEEFVNLYREKLTA